MKPRLTILAAAVVLTACGSSSADSNFAPSGPRAPCGPAGAQTLSANRLARVYVVNRIAYGCAVHGSGDFRLGQRSACIGAAHVGPVILADELAAYGLERCGVDTGSTQVVVRRLTNGKQMLSAPATSPSGPESYQSVDSIALKSDGAVAWIGVGSSIVGHNRRIEVRKAEKGVELLLDRGPAIQTGSLRLHHSTLTWKHGVATRSATLR